MGIDWEGLLGEDEYMAMCGETGYVNRGYNPLYDYLNENHTVYDNCCGEDFDGEESEDSDDDNDND